jgi:hypothetical protein
MKWAFRHLTEVLLASVTVCVIDAHTARYQDDDEDCTPRSLRLGETAYGGLVASCSNQTPLYRMILAATRKKGGESGEGMGVLVPNTRVPRRRGNGATKERKGNQSRERESQLQEGRGTYICERTYHGTLLSLSRGVPLTHALRVIFRGKVTSGRTRPSAVVSWKPSLPCTIHALWRARKNVAVAAHD